MSDDLVQTLRTLSRSLGSAAGVTVGRAADRIEELKVANLALAAGQCANASCDDGITPRCKQIMADEALKAADRIEALEAEIERQRSVISRVNSQIDHLGMAGKASKARDEALMRQALSVIELICNDALVNGIADLTDEELATVAAIRKRLGEEA